MNDEGIVLVAASGVVVAVVKEVVVVDVGAFILYF